MSIIRIGKIAYTNVLPVFHFFRDGQFANKVEIIDQVPAELNRRMAAGTIDLGPMSSFAYADNNGAYEALADLSVSALGAVGSIFLFSKRPIEELKEPRIALTNTSATSVNLLKIILQKFHGAHPEYTTMDPELPRMMDQADAAMLIGDEALMARLQNPGYHIYDLGELWYKHTGMWMTFALWCVRKSIIENQGDLLGDIHQEFLRSKQHGLAHLNEIILYVRSRFAGTFEFWNNYFSGLNHDFGPEQKRGLEYYYRCAAEIGVLSEPVQVQVWGAERVSN